MSDVIFKFQAVPNRYQDVIQRMAVLYALRQPAQTAHDVVELTQQLVDQWRARIGALTSAGWEPSAGTRANHSILYARNCKPTFVMTLQRTRPCHNRLVCPFCYARWVREVWQMIDAEFPAPDPVAPTTEETEAGRVLRSIALDTESEEPALPHRTTFRFHLVERHHYFTRPVLPEGNPQGLTLFQNLAGLLNNIEQQRSAVVDMVDPVGAFIYTTIEPDEQRQHWRLHHRQIFKLTPDQEFPKSIEDATSGRLTRYDRPTRKDILQIVARVCRYPVTLITGDPERTVQLLTARRNTNFRGYSRFRSFRRTRQYDD